MTVSELIKTLEAFDGTLDVVACWDGDYSDVGEIRIAADRRHGQVVTMNVSEYASYRYRKDDE